MPVRRETGRHRGKRGEEKNTRGSNVMLQQIPQPFVMATFISTTLIPLQSLYQTLGRLGERGKEKGRGTTRGKLEEVK